VVATIARQRVNKSKGVPTANCSNQNLTEKQTVYAANDRHAALCMYRQLSSLG